MRKKLGSNPVPSMTSNSPPPKQKLLLSRHSLLRLLLFGTAISARTCFGFAAMHDSVQNAPDHFVTFSQGAKDPAQAWALTFTTPAHAPWRVGQSLLSFDSGDSLPLSLRVVQEGSTQLLQVQMTTTSHKEPLSLAVPLAMLKANRQHEFLLRYLGFRVDLFCDGVLVDEEWPMGELPFASGIRSAIFHDPIQQPRFRLGALSDDSIQTRYGGRATVAERANEMLGPEPTGAQYRKPRGWNTNAGDAMPFYHDGIFHLYYLIDRRHHHSKWGLGAHQWAHLASSDLLHWTSYPPALSISEQWEGSICTGSVFYDKGTYYAFYATRMPDRKEHLALALSRDGIRFEKVLPSPFRGPETPFREGPNRDPHVNREGERYLMLVTAALAAKKEGQEQGALEQLVSKDLKHWSAVNTPFLVPGYSPQPECSDLFLWRGRYYLLFGINGVTHYRMGNSLHGPWTKPTFDTLDAGEARVMKTAEFHNGRRMLVGWVGYDNFGGNLVFRELLQNPDGTLGTKFPEEMNPDPKGPRMIRIDTDHSAAALPRFPGTEWRLVLQADPTASVPPYGLTFRGEKGRTEVLFVDPAKGTVEWRDATGRIRNELVGMLELNRQATLEVVRKDDLVDVCVNNRRTMIHRLGVAHPEVSLFIRETQGNGNGGER